MKYIIKTVSECSEANDICEKFEKKNEVHLTMKKDKPKDKYYKFQVTIIIK